jgi:hypothetical protein
MRCGIRHKTLQSELAGLPEQVRADLALLEVADENSLRPPRQESREVGLPKVQRQLSQIVALQRQDVEGVELNLVVMPARVQPIEIGNAVDAEENRFAIDNERSAFGSAARLPRSAGNDRSSHSRFG